MLIGSQSEALLGGMTLSITKQDDLDPKPVSSARASHKADEIRRDERFLDDDTMTIKIYHDGSVRAGGLVAEDNEPGYRWVEKVVRISLH